MASSFHAQVAEQLIVRLRAGTAPWQVPWEPGMGSVLPMNPTTGQRYKGINAVWLLAQGKGDPRWMTYRQAQRIEAQVRKGEKGTAIQYWQFSLERKKVDGAGNPVLDAEGNPILETVRLERPRVFFATVFNATQIEGLPSLERRTPTWDPIERAEKILHDSGARIAHDSASRALYRVATDTIHLPEKGQFPSADRYYATALHELGHWTGHGSRLGRDLANPFGSEEYAREELRAEIASMILGEELGIGHDPAQHAAYVGSWIKILENDSLEIFRAAADAERIQQFVLGLEQRQMQTEQVTVPDAEREVPRSRNVEGSTERAEERVYLEIPFAEKEEAKALGARWDRAARLWFVPAGIDVERFAKWARTQREAGRAERQYLAVPYEERAAAKAAGALWDRAARAWYAGPTADAEALRRWRPENGAGLQEPPMGPREEFAQVLEQLGCAVSGEHPILDGQPHRIALRDDASGERSGFYVAHLDGHPAGYAKNHRSGEELRWKAKGYSMGLLSETQREALRQEAAAKLAARAAEQDRLHEEAAQRLQAELEKLDPSAETTPYLERKGIRATPGVRADAEGTLHVPAYDGNEKQWTTQYIRADGTKRFAKGSRKEGCFHPLHGFAALRAAPGLVIAEGYATASSLAEAIGHTAVAAFDSGNLVSVARALREKFPDKPIVIAGDDDVSVAARRGVNPGRKKAEEAAAAVAGIAVFPMFAAEEQARNPKGYTDWNDLVTRSGLGREAAERQIRRAVQAAVAAQRRAGVEDAGALREGHAAEGMQPVSPGRRSAAFAGEIERLVVLAENPPDPARWDLEFRTAVSGFGARAYRELRDRAEARCSEIVEELGRGADESRTQKLSNSSTRLEYVAQFAAHRAQARSRSRARGL